MSEKEPQEVDARVIDRDLAHPLDAEMAAKAERLRAEREELARCVADLQGLTPEQLEREEAQQVRAWRKDVISRIDAVEAIRKEVKAAYLAPLEAWEDGIRSEVAPARAVKAMLSDEVRRRQQEERDLREQGLRMTYEDYMRGNGMGAVLDLVPWERIREERWLNKATMPTDACAEILGKVRRLVQDRDALAERAGGSRFLDDALAELYRTLDLGAAVRRLGEREEEQRRIDAAKAEQAEAEAWREQQPEPEPEPEPTPEPGPAPGPEPERTRRWVIRVMATESQKDGLIQALRRLGIHGTVRADE